MKLLTSFLVFAILVVICSGAIAHDEIEPIGPYSMPNSVGLGQKFRVEYINNDVGKNVTVEFYPILSQLLPYQYSADEYHGKKYGNITRLIDISRCLSAAWYVNPHKINLKNVGAKFNITVSLSYIGYWDMLLIFKFANGTEDFMIHSLPQVVKSIDFNEIFPWVIGYLGGIFIIVFIVVPMLLKRKIKHLIAASDTYREE